MQIIFYERIMAVAESVFAGGEQRRMASMSQGPKVTKRRLFRCHAVAIVWVGALSLYLATLAGCDGGGTPSSGPVPAGSAAAADGQRWFAQTCVACHGPTGHGVPRMGPSLHNNRFIADSTDEQLTEFLREGRSPTDPKSVTKLPMPARGGNPNLTDDNLRQVVAYLREMQKS